MIKRITVGLLYHVGWWVHVWALRNILIYTVFPLFEQVICLVYLSVTVTGTAEGTETLHCGHLSPIRLDNYWFNGDGFIKSLNLINLYYVAGEKKHRNFYFQTLINSTSHQINVEYLSSTFTISPPYIIKYMVMTEPPLLLCHLIALNKLTLQWTGNGITATHKCVYTSVISSSVWNAVKTQNTRASEVPNPEEQMNKREAKVRH